jgi:hypothetical protein
MKTRILKHPVVNAIDNQTAEIHKLREFVEMIARMKTEAEFGDEQPSIGDWIDTLCNLIASARQLTGVEPEKENA